MFMKKRFIALLVTAVMVFGCVTAYGKATDNLFDALFNPVYSGKINMTFSAETKELPKMLEDSNITDGWDSPVDFMLLAESLLKSKGTVHGEYNVSKDMQKAQMAFTYKISSPVCVNECLEIQANSKWSFWIDYDFDAENPTYKIIYKTPLSKKYTYMDMTNLPSADSASTAMPSEEDLKDMTSAVSEIYKSCAKISKQGNGYKIVLDDNGFKLFCAQMFDFAAQVGETQFLKTETAPSEIKDFKTYTEDMKEAFSQASPNFEVLGKGGLVINLSANKGGYVTSENLSLDLKLNIFDILNAFGMYNGTSGITKENSSFEAVFKAKADMSMHNQNVKVEFPLLTDENSVNLLESQTAVWEEGDLAHKWFSLEDEGLPVICGTSPMIDLEKMCEKLDFDYTYENGVANVDTKTSLGTFEFTDGEKNAKSQNDGQALKTAAAEKGGKLFVGFDGAAVLGVEISNVSYYADEDLTYTYGYFENPDYVEPEEEFWQTTEENFEIASVENVSIFEEDGKIYFPVAPFLGEFNVGTEEISVQGKNLSVESPNAYGFSSLKLQADSVYAEKDGESILLKSPVRYRDSFYVAADFAEVFGFELQSMDFYGWNDEKAAITFEKELN